METSQQQPWEQIAAQKRAARDALLAPYLADDAENRPPRAHRVEERSRLGDGDDAITDLDGIEGLVGCMQRGEASAVQVVTAYIRRAAIAHQLTNCLTEVLFDSAIEQARQLDADFKSGGRLRGPLHGVPFTVKDQFNVKGVDSTLGYVGRSFQPAGEGAVLVSMVRRLGGIVIAKTNLAQSIMWAETENPLWGLTTNARSPAFTPGGSTGGESPLLALHGSLLGFGTDLGGSIRIPQSIAGLYGFKPTSRRFPYEGVPVSAEGQEHVPSSFGPMTRDLDSICYVTKAVADARPWDLDPRCVPLPWDEAAFQEVQRRPMVVGLIVDDGVVRVHPPIARALEELVAALRCRGHEVVPWDTSDHESCIGIVDRCYTVDGGEDIRRDVAAAGEPYVPHVEELVNRGEPISVWEYWQLNKLKLAAQKRYLDKWNAARSPSGKPVDVLLSPTMCHTSVPHRTIRWIGYTKIWNLLDYPALTLPVGEVRAGVDGAEDGYAPRNELDAWNWGLYDADAVDGYPVSLQIVGKKFEEERVLGAAVAMERAWKGR